MLGELEDWLKIKEKIKVIKDLALAPENFIQGLQNIIDNLIVTYKGKPDL